jgi:putative NADH-flavin reductase
LNVVVFGATGGTGRRVVERALEEGHGVTAVARNPATLREVPPHLRVERGDVLDAGALGPALEGQDAVVSALGSRGRGPTTLYSEGTRNILRAMREHGVPRLVAVSAGAYVRDPADPFVVRFVVKPLLARALAAPYRDMRRMEELIRASGLDWTLVRPARLTDGPRRGRYRTAIEGSVPGGWTISRADVADLIVTRLADPELRRVAVSVAY